VASIFTLKELILSPEGIVLEPLEEPPDEPDPEPDEPQAAAVRL